MQGRRNRYRRAELAALACLAVACERQAEPSPQPAGASAEPTLSGGLVIVNPTDPERHYNFDLGHVPFGEVRELTVNLKNSDPDSLTILDILPACGCTSARIRAVRESGEVVEGRMDRKGDVLTLSAGAVAELSLSLDTRRVQNVNASKRILVRVRSNSRSNPFLTLEVHLIVDQPFQAIPARIDLKRVGASAGGAATTEIFAATNEALRLSSIASTSEHLEAELSSQDLYGREVWTLSVQLVPPISLGLFQGHVRLEISDADGAKTDRTFEVEIAAFIVPDLSVSPPELAFPSGSAADVAVARTELFAMLPGQRVRVLSAELRGEGASDLAADYAPVKPDEDGRSTQWEIRLRAAPSLRGTVVAGTLTLFLDDVQTPQIDVPYRGRFAP